MAHDLVIRAGRVVDGPALRPARPTSPSTAGSSPPSGGSTGRGQREIDADGALVTPGLRRHPHPLRRPGDLGRPARARRWHGVTTVVMGNCGVGFAPVRPADHERLIELMEGVEDIPGTALHEGISWDWETFPEYLDALARGPATSTSAPRCRTARCACT